MPTLTAAHFQKNPVGLGLPLVKSRRVRPKGHSQYRYLTARDNITFEGDELKRRAAAQEFIRTLENAKTSEAAKSLTQEEINKLIERCLA